MAEMTKAAQAAQKALERVPEPMLLDEPAFEIFMQGIAREVFKNVVAVRSGKMKPEEAAARDDANVRNLARLLMNEHDRMRLSLPKTGPALAFAMRENIPALFAKMDQAVDAANPRALMVHASRVFLSEIYTLVRACAAEGDALTPEMAEDRIERMTAVWAVRFMGDEPALRN